ncbi:MAG: hypothetical protein K2Z81_22610, partial [Cyanobacteria bacterium]|nr:hypothetical protein [Cyanobacteriota bacterium]
QVFLCTDAVSFIVFWELMSLSAVALILTDHRPRKVRSAALIYLGATRVSTTLLLICFLWLHALTNSWSFADWHGIGEPAAIPLLIAFVGLCIKAGIWPFHLWLPYAHAEAPAPVSALMSGVMVKVAIYAMIRLLLFAEWSSPLLTYFAIIVGTISAFWGILFAQMETDMKRLLAYSTVENVGLIVLGIGLVLLAKGNNESVVASISLAACLFHCLNHGTGKPLLFLAAGAVDWSVHSRSLSQLGGLQRYLPFTAMSFFLGSMVLCALPPLNGFASKWLLYQGLFSIACASSTSQVDRALCLSIIGFLSMIGALSVALFAKSFSLCFLGRPRSHAVQRAHEMPVVARLSQALLIGACIVLSVSAAYVPSWLAPAAQGILPVFAVTVKLPEPQLLVALLILLSVFYATLLSFNRQKVKYFSTWECGFGSLPARSSIGPLSFSRSVAVLFKLIVQFHTVNRISGTDRRHFPDAVTVEGHRTILVEKLLYRPILNAISGLGNGLIRLQTGSIHVHLLYVFITLISLLFIGIGNELRNQ